VDGEHLFLFGLKPVLIEPHLRLKLEAIHKAAEGRKAIHKATEAGRNDKRLKPEAFIKDKAARFS